MASKWRSKLLPRDFNGFCDCLLPPDTETKYGKDWPEWRRSCIVLTGVLAIIEMMQRGSPPTFGDLCHALQEISPADITDDKLLAIAERGGETIHPALQDILDMPSWYRERLVTILATFARDYEQHQEQAQ